MNPKLTLLISAFLVIASECDAQDVHPGVAVRVQAPSRLLKPFDGVYVGRSGDTLIFGNDARGPVKVPAAAITALDVSRGKSRLAGAAHGALWGGGVSGLIGLLVAGADATSDSGAMPGATSYVFMMATGGAEIGAIVGAIVGKRAWTRANLSTVLNTAHVDVHRLGVQLALRF
jgi:hypothetical protein